jgi:WhiB family redox-sensing transcriptional regulator
MNDIFLKDYPDFFSQGTPPCATSDPDAFFPVESEDIKSSGRSKYYNEAGAKAVCAECPYMIECLKYAVKNSELGIWGGTNESERRRIRRTLNHSKKTIEQIAVNIKR